METRSNRLCPQSMLSSTATANTLSPSGRHMPQKLMLRRRCRSECLPMGPVLGVSTEPKQYDELRRKAPHSPKSTQPPVQATNQQQQQPSPAFRKHLRHLLKYSPDGVLRNHDSSKNIFSFVDTRKNGGSVTGGCLKSYTKENVVSAPSLIPSSVSEPVAYGADAGGIRTMDSLFASTYAIDRHHADKAYRSQQQLDVRHKYQCVDTVSYEALPATARYTTTCGGDNKRRVRSRSESDPHEYQSKQLAIKSTTDRPRVFDTVLKRSRDDKSHNLLRNNVDFDEVVPKPPPSGAIIAAVPTTHTTVAATKQPLVNPNYTKLVSRPCTPRYPIKPLNGLRKLRPRTTLARNKSNKAMVVSAPVASRCAAPAPHEAVQPEGDGGDETVVSKTTNGISDAHKVDAAAAAEESDTGCSSLDDDDDFDDIGDGDFNDSLSESEDSGSLTSQLTTSLDAKLSDGTITTSDCVRGRAVDTSAPLVASLFPHVPPYITFASHAEKGATMPAAVTKVLKWKLTTITPIVIRKVLLNSGFRLLRSDGDNPDQDSDDETNDWMGVWGKHMKSPCFKTIRSYQKINHIPGTFQIGRKDRVWRNLQMQMSRHGKKEFGFMPRTYVIPNDLKQLRKIWPRYSQHNVKWIIKPPASARGTGIKVVNRWSQIPKRKPLIVQRYIERPLLINGSKFDLRLYVLVTSINPLRVYMHTDGLARFASVKYSEKSDTLHDRYMHLTNYSINKLSSNYSKNEDANACKGHKWTVKSLWTHLAAQGVNVTGLWGALRNLVLRTILAGENPINQLTKINMGSNYNCYELFGIDVILDSELKPWLLEVNISPSLHSASPLDLHVKGPLVQALLNASLFQVPPRIPVTQQHEIMKEQKLSGNLCYDKRIFVTNLSKVERAKHTEFTGSTMANREDYLGEILKMLTPDDIRCLLIAEDELARSAPLERIFPTSNTYKYQRFIEHPRYYNRLMDAWENRYGADGRRKDGIALLRIFCQNKIHLCVPPPPVKKDSENSSNTDTTAASPTSPLPTENGVKQVEDEDNHNHHHHHHYHHHHHHNHNGANNHHLIAQSVPKTIPSGFASDTATATAVMPMAAAVVIAKHVNGAGDHPTIVNGDHFHQPQQLLLLQHNGQPAMADSRRLSFNQGSAIARDRQD